MDLPLASESWEAWAECRGMNPDLFFGDELSGPDVYGPAKRVCSGCRVRDDCLEFAVEHGLSFGVWGGLSPKERRQARKVAA